VAVALLLVPIGAALALWLPPRLRWARAAGAAKVLRSTGDLELLALRALARRPLPELAGLGPQPLRRLLAGDPEVTAALAGSELRALGLRPQAQG
jgi:hypothetical protein